MTYVLMSRAVIDVRKRPVSAEFWRKWLAQRDEDREMGYAVSRAMSAKYTRDVESVRLEAAGLAKQAANDRAFAEMVKKATEALGIKWHDGWYLSERAAKSIAEQIKELAGARPLSPEQRSSLRSVLPALTALAQEPTVAEVPA